MERKMDDEAFSTARQRWGHIQIAHSSTHSRKEKLYEVQALQCRVLEYQRENVALRAELDLKDSKLSSCMRSVELFWSPELNKERKARKLENEKLAAVTEECERLKVGDRQSQCHLSAARLHGDVLSSDASDTDSSPGMSTKFDSQSKLEASPGQFSELQALRKTLDEMELRVNSQKSALVQREDTIKNLLERLQTKTAEVNSLHEQINKFNVSEMTFKLEAAEEEITNLNTKNTEHEFEHMKAIQRQRELYEQLRQKQLELEEAKQRAHECTSHVASLQTSIEQKDSQLNQLLQIIKDRDEKIHSSSSFVQELQSAEVNRRTRQVEAAAEERQEERRQLEALQSHSKFMKAKIESLKQELAKKDVMVTEHIRAVSELSKSSQTQISQLEEVIATKAKECERLQKNAEALMIQLTDKNSLISEYEATRESSKTSCNELSVQVQGLEAAVCERDKTIAHLTEEFSKVKAGIHEKECALQSSERSLAACKSDQQHFSDVVQSFEERLMVKERNIEMLKEQRVRYDSERDEERDGFKQTVEQLKAKVKSSERSLEDTESKLSAAQDDLLSLHVEITQKNTRILALEQEVVEKDMHLEDEQKKSSNLKLAQQKATKQRQQLETEIGKLGKKLSAKEKELQEEVERNSNEVLCQQLQNRISKLEEELRVRNASIDEMARIVSNQGTKLAGLKRSQLRERTQSAQLLGQAKQREDKIENDMSQLQDHVTDKNHRITELEAAFKESMEMIVSRESQLESEKRKCAHTEGELKLSQRQVTELKELQETLQSRLAGVYSQLQDREALIASLRAERQCQTEELMELKQNALLSAISEKDANIALLETSPNKEKHQDAIHTLHCQKDQLVVELKEWTQRRVRFHRGDEDGMSSQLAEELSDASPDQVLQAIRNMDDNMTRLRSYIDQLLAVVLEQCPGLLEGMPRRQQGQGQSIDLLCGCSLSEMLQELREKERNNFNLQGYANLLLQRIMEQQPSILEAVAILQS
ncbi:ELKS/Rab6-interacting/CAST family member 1-like isoform X2 [Corticium candelabrum]|uniref:ELKS/Rab6-interacting/CAST family member 1-like isoform X2 n=1 Tax=Corticium candelabrum TaxID=121492 RepID=UPI002E26DCE5|nr:ELKS/Rab6-interacting/CAST family member 1-like isoform X2 [Corticium candelabrum]